MIITRRRFAPNCKKLVLISIFAITFFGNGFLHGVQIRRFLDNFISSLHIEQYFSHSSYVEQYLHSNLQEYLTETQSNHPLRTVETAPKELTLYERALEYIIQHPELIQRDNTIEYLTQAEAIVVTTILSEGEHDSTIETYEQHERAPEYAKQWTAIANVMQNRAKIQSASLLSVAKSGAFHGIRYNPLYHKYYHRTLEDYRSVQIDTNENGYPEIDVWKLTFVRALYWMAVNNQLEDITGCATHYAHPLDDIVLKEAYGLEETGVVIGNHTYLRKAGTNCSN